jgi:glucose/arabinose dehydrogenase
MGTVSSVLLALGLTHAPAAPADTIDGQAFTVDKIYQGDNVIWGFDFLSTTSPDEIVFSERQGWLRYLKLSTGAIHDIVGTPAVYAGGHGGLLDVYIDHKSGFIYLTYAESLGGDRATTSLFRGKLSADQHTLQGAAVSGEGGLGRP